MPNTYSARVPAPQFHQLPSTFRPPVREFCRRILRKYPNTVAFAVIGSVADSTWESDSDIDLVWILSGRRRKRWHAELEYDYSGVVELVPLNLKELRRHVAQHSSLAHSIQKGLVLYDAKAVLERLKQTPLGPPTSEWKQEAFEFFSRRLDWGIDSYQRELTFHRKHCRSGHCHCHVSEILTRAVVNLARLLLIEQGLIPNSKAEMRSMVPAVLHSSRQRAALETALQAHHEKRDLSPDEAAELIRLGRNLRERLTRSLANQD